MPALPTVLPWKAAICRSALGAQLVPVPLSLASPQLPEVWARTDIVVSPFCRGCRTRMPALTEEITWVAAGGNSPTPSHSSPTCCSHYVLSEMASLSHSSGFPLCSRTALGSPP